MVASRIAFGLGALLTLSVIWLGFIWPSIYTPVALFALPSPVLLAAAAVRPALFEQHHVLRAYGYVCMAAAAACWVFQFLWLTYFSKAV